VALEGSQPLSGRIGLRLMSAEELAGDPKPDTCIEVSFGPVRPVNEPDLILLPTPYRITPADLVHLSIEAEVTLGDIRAEVMRAEIAWKRALGEWYAEGRRAAESRGPDVALLARVLEGLRNYTLAPT
jgi:hypothetical protein